MHRSCRIVVGPYLCFKGAAFLFEQAIDVTPDLLILVVYRVTFCPVDMTELSADLFVEVLLALMQLLNPRILELDFLPLCPPILLLYFDSDPYET